MPCLNIATFPVPRLLKLVANILTSICRSNDRIPCTPMSVFHSRAVPHIQIADYMTRILKFTPYSNEVLLCMLIYFDRIADSKTNAITLNSLNIHRFIITSIVIATKSTSDIYYRNSRYAKVGGITLQELYHLELEFLKLCDFRVHVPLEQLQHYADQVWNLSLNRSDIIHDTSLSTSSSVLSSPASSSLTSSSSTSSSPSVVSMHSGSPYYINSTTIVSPSSLSSSSSVASSVLLPLTPPQDSITATSNTQQQKQQQQQQRLKPPSPPTSRTTKRRYHPYGRLSSNKGE